MAAIKIFSRLRELLDINVTRSAPAWLRMEADGNVTERSAAETRADIGAASAENPSFTGTPDFNGTQSVWRSELGIADSPTITTKQSESDIQRVSDASYSDDPAFQFDVLAGEKYRLDFSLIFTSGGGGGKVQFVLPSSISTAANNSCGIFVNASGTVTAAFVVANAIEISLALPPTSGRCVSGFLVFQIGVTGGVLKTQFAQLASSADPTVRKEKSFISITKL